MTLVGLHLDSFCEILEHLVRNLKKVADNVNIPIATGERLLTKFDFADLVISSVKGSPSDKGISLLMTFSFVLVLP